MSYCASATQSTVNVMVTVIVGPASRSRSPDQSPGKVFAILWLLLSQKKRLRDSEEERGEPLRFKCLCHGIGVNNTQALTCRKSEQTLVLHYAGMMQDGLQIAGPQGGGGGVWLHTWGGGGERPIRYVFNSARNSCGISSEILRAISRGISAAKPNRCVFTCARRNFVPIHICHLSQSALPTRGCHFAPARNRPAPRPPRLKIT
jgi:hypothetical protein